MKRKFLFVEEKIMKPFFKQRGGNETVKKGLCVKNFLEKHCKRNSNIKACIIKKILNYQTKM